MNAASVYRKNRYIVSNVPDDGNVSDDSSVSADYDGNMSIDEDIYTDTDTSDDDDCNNNNEGADDAWPNQWTDDTVLPPVFNGSEGPSTVLPSDATPRDYFNLMFPESLWDLLVAETNRYAEQHGKTDKPTSIKEMQAFIGVMMVMNIRKQPYMSDYWRSQPFLGDDVVPQIFPRDRFYFLYNNMHLVDNTTILPRDHPDHDQLFKIRPLIVKLNEIFAELYSPCQHISVDESMKRFKSRSCFSSCRAKNLKYVERGFKVWCASCACCGYLLRFNICFGKEQNDVILAHRVVEDLVIPRYAGKNHIIYTNSFFTSLPLLQTLQESDVYLCGTCSIKSIGFPQDLINEGAGKKRLKRGTIITRYKKQTTAYLWQDNFLIYSLGNAHPPGISIMNRRYRDGSLEMVSCPVAINEYKRHMNGEGQGLSDKLKVFYNCNKKSKRWWYKLFFHLVDLCVINAYVLYCHCYTLHLQPDVPNRPMDQLMFRCELAEALVDHFTARSQPGPTTPTTAALVDAGHELVKAETLGIYKKGLCGFCSTGKRKKRQRKETSYACKKCRVRLCVTECFHKHHQMLTPQHVRHLSGTM